jgi:hypothetical protein
VTDFEKDLIRLLLQPGWANGFGTMFRGPVTVIPFDQRGVFRDRGLIGVEVEVRDSLGAEKDSGEPKKVDVFSKLLHDLVVALRKDLSAKAAVQSGVERGKLVAYIREAAHADT